MKQGKRWIALMLALAMCLSVLPANVLATELGSETETAENAAQEDTSEDTEAEEPQVTETGEPDEEPVEDVSPSTMAATSGKCGKNAKWSYNSKTKTLTISGKGAMRNYPSTVLDPEDDDEELPWHEAQLTIDKIVIKEGITSIGSYAFSNTYPKSVTIPNTVTSIGKYAFSTYCNENLKKVQIPESVKSIGAYAFEGQLGLTKVIISQNVKKISKGAFRWTHISEVYFKGDAPSIDKDAFEVFDKYGENLQPITFYYPKENKTWTDNKKKNYGAEQATWKTWSPNQPKGVSLVSVTNQKGKKLKVTWKKNAAATGYEVQYSTSSKFKSVKKVKIKKASTTSTTISKLTKGKKYYVRVRAYTKKNGKTKYTAWSAKKSVVFRGRMLTQKEAVAIARKHWKVKPGDIDPELGFELAVFCGGTTTRNGRKYYDMYLRWLVEHSHWSTVDYGCVDVYSGDWVSFY